MTSSIGTETVGGDMPGWDLVLPLLGVVAGLVVGVVVGFVTRAHDRQQQARMAYLEPATQFSRSALSALARLRYVTPPPLKEGQPHRNELLLTNKDERESRLEKCEDAIDVTRADRAHLRLVFGPTSDVAASSQTVLAHLRSCLEAAQAFYWEFDHALASGQQEQLWRSSHDPLRRSAKTFRVKTYEALEVLYTQVRAGLQRPGWNQRVTTRLPPKLLGIVNKVRARFSRTKDSVDPPAGSTIG